jgi:hypothetical protein
MVAVSNVLRGNYIPMCNPDIVGGDFFRWHTLKPPGPYPAAGMFHLNQIVNRVYNRLLFLKYLPIVRTIGFGPGTDMGMFLHVIGQCGLLILQGAIP